MVNMVEWRSSYAVQQGGGQITAIPGGKNSAARHFGGGRRCREMPGCIRRRGAGSMNDARATERPIKIIRGRIHDRATDARSDAEGRLEDHVSVVSVHAGQ